MWILHQETRNDLKHIFNDPLKKGIGSNVLHN